MSVKLPEHSLAGLRDLAAKAQHAQMVYTVAVNATVAALGLDPTQANTLDLDAGTVTPPEQS